MNEVWKDIKGYEGRYQISNFGNVRSLSRKVQFGNQTRIVKGKILKQKTKKTGYKFIQLRKNMKEYDFYIHRLVALHFVDGYAENMDVNHIDGNKAQRLPRLFIIEASERMLGKQQLTVTTETDRGFIDEIKNAKEVSRISVTWSYTNGDAQKGLAKILDDAAKKAGAARISAELYSAPGESLAVDEEDLSGAVLELSVSNAEGEASATIRNPEYNKNGKQIKANRKNVTTRNYPLKYVFTSKLPEVPGMVYDFIMSRFK